MSRLEQLAIRLTFWNDEFVRVRSALHNCTYGHYDGQTYVPPDRDSYKKTHERFERINGYYRRAQAALFAEARRVQK